MVDSLGAFPCLWRSSRSRFVNIAICPLATTYHCTCFGANSSKIRTLFNSYLATAIMNFINTMLCPFTLLLPKPNATSITNTLATFVFITHPGIL